MQATFDRAALADCLNIVSGAIASRSPKPIHTCVRISADDKGLEVSGTDGEVSIVMRTTRAETTASGVVVVPAAEIQKIVRECPDATLKIETKSDGATLTGSGASFELLGFPASDFPELSTSRTQDPFSIDAQSLHHLTACTLFATAKETSRYAINGVLFERKGSELNLVATDGHRLALATGHCTQANDGHVQAIIPSKALTLAQRMFGDDDIIQITISGTQATLNSEDAWLTTNLIDGSFPPYQDVIPKEHDKEAKLGRDAFLGEVRMASLLTSQETNSVVLELSENGAELRSSTPEKGQANISLKQCAYTGEPIRIGFSPTYLLEALKVIDQDEVQLDLKASNKPGVLRAGQHFTYVVMPVNI